MEQVERGKPNDEAGMQGVEFVAVNTDAQDLK